MLENAETPRSSWQEKKRHMRKKEPSQQKKETRSLSAVTSGVTTPKSFLLLVEGTKRPSLDDALTNLLLVAALSLATDPRLKHRIMNSSKL